MIWESSASNRETITPKALRHSAEIGKSQRNDSNLVFASRNKRSKGNTGVESNWRNKTTLVERQLQLARLRHQRIAAVGQRSNTESTFEKLCNACFNKGQPYLLILVNSALHHASRREAIRNTWGNGSAIWGLDGELKKTVKVVFVLGLNATQGPGDIPRESQRYMDIIQGNFIDSYSNLTSKTLLGLRFASQCCSRADYVMKTDDDTFVHLPNLIAALEKKVRHWSILGRLFRNSEVQRTGKWALGYDEYPFPTFPPYFAGSGYVMSGDVIGPLYQANKRSRRSLPLDDVYVTGILARDLGIEQVHDDRFAWFDEPYSILTDACAFRNKRAFTSTGLTTESTRKLWTSLVGRPQIIC